MMWIDISQTLKEGIANWPGDQPFQYQLDERIQEDSGANVGSISMSLHIGTHIDAPFHYDNNGVSMDEIDINRLIGTAQVIDCIDEPIVTRALLEKHHISESIVLFKSVYSKDESVFLDEYMTIDADAIDYLASLDVQCIGTDMPSIDPTEDLSLLAHKSCHKHQILIIENLELNKVREGIYDFIGLPLKIAADASPIRAVVKRK